jgi:hypothetical protein
MVPFPEQAAHSDGGAICFCPSAQRHAMHFEVRQLSMESRLFAIARVQNKSPASASVFVIGLPLFLLRLEFLFLAFLRFLPGDTQAHHRRSNLHLDTPFFGRFEHREGYNNAAKT